MSFKLDLSKAIEGVKKDRDKIVRGTLISVSSNVIRRTPVGNPSLWKSKPPKGYVGGSLRGAWNASIGSPDFSINKRRKAKTGGAAIGRVAQVVKSLDAGAGQTFYLTNPLPYAGRVERGWSGQAPQGMVRVSLVEAQGALDRLAK